jgi:hypothetical protein
MEKKTFFSDISQGSLIAIYSILLLVNVVLWFLYVFQFVAWIYIPPIISLAIFGSLTIVALVIFGLDFYLRNRLLSVQSNVQCVLVYLGLTIIVLIVYLADQRSASFTLGRSYYELLSISLPVYLIVVIYVLTSALAEVCWSLTSSKKGSATKSQSQ